MPEWIKPEWINPISLCLLLIAVGHILWAISRWTFKTDQVCKDTPGALKTIKDEISDIRQKLSSVQKHIKELLALFPRRYVAARSPVHLTDLGKEAAVEMGTHAWATSVAPSLVDQVRGKKEFEIYEFCSEYVRELKNDKALDSVAEYAYNHGADGDLVLTVLIVILRDELLKLLGMAESS